MTKAEKKVVVICHEMMLSASGWEKIDSPYANGVAKGLREATTRLLLELKFDKFAE